MTVSNVINRPEIVSEATRAKVHAAMRELLSGLVPGEYIVAVTDMAARLTGYTLTSGAQSSSNPSTPITVACGQRRRAASASVPVPVPTFISMTFSRRR